MLEDVWIFGTVRESITTSPPDHGCRFAADNDDTTTRRDDALQGAFGAQDTKATKSTKITKATSHYRRFCPLTATPAMAGVGRE